MLSFESHCNVALEKTDGKIVLYNHLSYICTIAYRIAGLKNLSLNNICFVWKRISEKCYGCWPS